MLIKNWMLSAILNAEPSAERQMPRAVPNAVRQVPSAALACLSLEEVGCNWAGLIENYQIYQNYQIFIA